MYRIVCVEPGYLAKVKEGYLYEVPENYIIRNRTFPGIADLQNCEDLQAVRDLLSDVGTVVLALSGETLADLLAILWNGNDNGGWYDRNPDIHIWQTETGFSALVYVDKDQEDVDKDHGGHA